MNAGRVSAWADFLESALAGATVKQVCRPEPFFLGLALSGGRRTLGFCIRPDRLAVGICEWPWPKGDVPEVLRVHLKGARLTGIKPCPGEPILRLTLASDGPRHLVWEGLGRSANLLLLGPDDEIFWSARTLKGGFRTGTPGETWLPPPPKAEADHPASGSADAAGDLRDWGPALLRDALLESGRRLALKTLKNREKRLKRRLEAVREDRREGERWLGEARLGQALLASGRLHDRGQPSMECTDYEADPPTAVTVPLDPSLTVLENSERFFKKARKGKDRVGKTGQILQEIGRDLQEIQARMGPVEKETDLDKLFPERREARSAPKGRARRQLPRGVVEVPLPQGFSGYAGKSAEGNDIVTFRIGRGSDFWFHAADYPGCHVVVKNPARLEGLPRQVEVAAALHAARYSGAPPGNRLAVSTTQCKHLRKIKGEKGRVMMANARTILVDLPVSG